jgi:maleylacetoacetate isomerase
MLKLFTYYRSVSTHRVRIALNHKGVGYTPIYVDQDRDEHQDERYLQLNPQGLVPALVVDDELVITQSFAILEYLEERYPERPLLPKNPELRAQVRSFAQVLVADMNPLIIMRVFRYMRDDMQLSLEQRREWYERWAHTGFRAAESTLERDQGDAPFCYGQQPTLADVCLVPQVYSALKAGLDLAPYPRVRGIYRTCSALAAFQAAGPKAQGDKLAQSL